MTSLSLHQRHYSPIIPVEDSPWEINWHISWFQLIVVDEIGQVNSHIIKHIMKTFDALPSNPIIIFLGDAHQSLPLITVQGKTNFDSSFFSSLMTRLFKKFELHTSHRSTTLYKEFLDKIRSFNITFDEIKRIFEHTKIPSTNKVTGKRILAIITENPNTIYIASSHKTKDFINKTVMNYLFRDEEPDIEVIDSSGKCQVYFVGSIGKIINVQSTIIAVETARTTVYVYPIYDSHRTYYYPIIPAYCQTALKCQGQTLPHITWAIDRDTIGPGIGYVVLSRVREARNVEFATVLTAKHITPMTILQS
ncbi:uncharacterized protein LOC130649492 isoform X2 [Hydractinia symbiolongicarpus]|uniref:uncharacterized protein LOC130649492 isoform X2 n=1 Tax=Hydractinia symbiolongicarpus TaxID=13093 RepID=UPI00254D5A9E|nr:uncharacterized protein LOC130649492 isoform X2 [Hydractinia symbiolongicarpus]